MTSDANAEVSVPVQSQLLGADLLRAAKSGREGVSVAFQLALISVIGCALAFAFQLNRVRATYFDGEIIPADNDAFYHARRILDTALDPRGFYQFDPRLHAPDGTLLPWPWGYDYIVAAIVRMASAAGISTDPLAILVYVPPFAVILSVLLVTLIARQSGLGTITTALLVLAVAASPLTQALHGLGCVDHHYAEYLFILSFLASALAWARRPTALWSAAFTGLVLGFAPAIHTLLFILQVPLLVSLAILWIRGQSPDRRAAGCFVAALAVGTIVAVAPSQALREGHFEYYYLAWFHVYVAACTIAAVGLLTYFKPDYRGGVAAAVITVIAILPILPQLHHASGYLSDGSSVLASIGEAKSVWRMATEDPSKVIRLYSALIFLVPVLALASLVAALRTRKPVILLLCVYSAMALPLLLMQFRFYYYGSLVIVLLPLILLDRVWRLRDKSRWALPCAAAMAAILVAAYVPAVSQAIASERIPGRDPYFVLTRLAMPALAKACKEDPGIVLAKNNEGNYIRYYTECSVISNNFLISPADIRAFYTIARLFGVSPAEVKRDPIPVKYVLVRARGAVAVQPGNKGFMVADREDARRISDQLTDDLLWSDPSSVDPSFELVAEIPAPGRDYAYARIWKIRR